MSIDQEVRIAELEAELEMERAKNRPKAIYCNHNHAVGYGSVNDWDDVLIHGDDLNITQVVFTQKFKYCPMCGIILDSDSKPKPVIKIKPISADRMGEIIDKARRKR